MVVDGADPARQPRVENDYELARRLQEAELRNYDGAFDHGGNVDHPVPVEGSSDHVRDQTNDIAYSLRASPRFVAIIIVLNLIEVVVGLTILFLSPVSSTCSFTTTLQAGIILFIARHVITIPHEQFRANAQRTGNRNAQKLSHQLDMIRMYTFLLFASMAIFFLFDVKNTTVASGCSSIDVSSGQRLKTLAIVLITVHLAITFSSVVIVSMVCLCFPCLVVLIGYLRPEGINGMNANTIKEIPSRVFQEAENHSDYASNPPTCVICQTDYVDGDILKHLKCNHEFHSECLDQWLLLKATCPLCREPVDDRAAASSHAENQEVEIPPIDARS